MGLIKTAGIVTKTVKYGETSIIATVVTKELGKISVIANGARTGKSRFLAAMQLFAYSELVVYKSKSGKGLYRLNEASVAVSFSGIRESLEKLAYAAYFAEVINCVMPEDAPPDEELLRLFLNVLFVLEKEMEISEKIKTVFEWRIAREAGIAPLIEGCFGCGKAPSFIIPSKGTAACRDCAAGCSGAIELSPSMFKIIDYILNADGKKIFSFSAGEDTVKYLSRISELYLKVQLEQEFQTLEYLKKVMSI